MKKMIFAALLVVSTSHATTLKFECANSESHSLQLSVDDSLLITSTSSPKLADVSFVLDSTKYAWAQTQYLSFVIAPEETATEFRHDAVNKLYIQYSSKLGEANVNLTVERKSFDFECSVTQ